MGQDLVYETSLNRRFERLFQRCVVAIEAGEGRGTGFFIDDGLVVTCHHVIERRTGGVAIQWAGRGGAAYVLERRDLAEQDLALLLVNPHWRRQHPSVALNPEVSSGDWCYIFGFSDLRPNGDPARIQVDGQVRSLLKLRDGQVRPGHSGSPVLNIRTGYVCGLIQVTRDRTLDLGGIGRIIGDGLILHRNRAFNARCDVWDRVRRGDRPKRPAIRANIRELSPSGKPPAVDSAPETVAETRQPIAPSEQEPLAFDALHLLPHEDCVVWAEFSPDGTRIVTASSDSTARLWDVDGNEVAILKGHKSGSGVRHAAFSPDGSLVVTSSGDGTARIWNAARGDEVHVLRGHEESVDWAVFSPDGLRIVTASDDTTAAVWDVADGRIAARLAPAEGLMRHAEFSPNGDRIVTASLGKTSHDGTARVWDTVTGRQVAVLRGHQDTLWHAAFSPEGTRIVTGSLFSNPRVWNAARYRRTMTLEGHKGNVTYVVFNRDGTRILTVGTDATRVWNADTGDQCAVLEGEYNSHAAFSPDGKRIATAGKYSVAHVWAAENGRRLGTLRGHEGAVLAALFSPDGRLLVSASVDGTAIIWAART